MVLRKTAVVPICVSMLAAVAAAVWAAEDRQKEKGQGAFLRLERDAQRSPVALEAAIVHLAPADRGKAGPTVDLVAAVHVAEKSYYESLNREFAEYDVVLYELVAPEGTKVIKGGSPGKGPVSMLQVFMKDMLELEFQLQHIDYTQKNMVHADMSPEQFGKSMQERGESVWTYFMRMMGYAMSRQGEGGGDGDVQLLLALLNKDRAMALKRVLAEQFADMEGSFEVLDGPNGSTLLSGRNKVALEVLRKQIAAGKRKIAIFYGAGHMPDFQERLRAEFGLAPVSTRWLVAWNLKTPPKAAKGKTSQRPRGNGSTLQNRGEPAYYSLHKL